MMCAAESAAGTPEPDSSAATAAPRSTTDSSMASAAVQAVLQEAVRAQEFEDEGDISSALECYYRATSQLSYFVDTCRPDTSTALADLCNGLGQQYEQRMAVLRSRQEAKAPHWLQLEQTRAHGQPGFTSSAATSTALDCHSMGRLQQQLLPMAQMQQAVFAAAAGGSGLEQVFDEPSSLAGNSSQLDLLNSCQRAVSGSLDDVVGLEDVKFELEEAVFQPLQFPHLFKGIRQPARAFLLHGPAGTGKTLLVEKVAAEAGFMLLSISPSMILSKWAGDSEKAISGVFDIARSFQPCIIFLDEVDSLGQSRGSNTDAGARRLLTELLVQFTRAAGEKGVYVFGATNRMQDCDPALLRRFSRRIEVPLPDTPARDAFFRAMLSRPEVESDLSTDDISTLVQCTLGYSGSDLADLCRTAALAPVRELMKQQRQLGRKRRRLGLCLELPSSVCRGSEQSEGSCAAASTPVRSAACAAMLPAAESVSQQTALGTDGVAAGANSGAGFAADGQAVGQASVQLRALVLSDFKAALELVKPAAVDAGAAAG